MAHLDTRSSQTSTGVIPNSFTYSGDFNPRGLRRPRRSYQYIKTSLGDFNPRGLRRPRQLQGEFKFLGIEFQSTRSSQTSTQILDRWSGIYPISIHEVFADLDKVQLAKERPVSNFNPRGLRRPRRFTAYVTRTNTTISIHEVFADLDLSSVRLSGYNIPDFNPRGLRRPRRLRIPFLWMRRKFQSTRSSQTSTAYGEGELYCIDISIHEVFADLDTSVIWIIICFIISIHEVFADLDRGYSQFFYILRGFQSTRSSQTSTSKGNMQQEITILFQSTRSSQTSTNGRYQRQDKRQISIHEVFADLDGRAVGKYGAGFYFNPRGLRRPRHRQTTKQKTNRYISIHEVFADLDRSCRAVNRQGPYFNPRGLRRPRRHYRQMTDPDVMISIHEVFADLDSIGNMVWWMCTNFNPRGLRRPRPVP